MYALIGRRTDARFSGGCDLLPEKSTGSSNAPLFQVIARGGDQGFVDAFVP
jgi:hypothetical protein